MIIDRYSKIAKSIQTSQIMATTVATIFIYDQTSNFGISWTMFTPNGAPTVLQSSFNPSVPNFD